MDNNCCGLFVNGKPVSEYGGAALLEYSIGETPLDNSIFQGVNRTSWNLLKSIFGMRTVTLTVIFTGETLNDAKVQRSKFNLEIYGVSELFIADDGFYYSVALMSTGPEIIAGIGEKTAQIKSEYQFKGIRHDRKATITIPAGGGDLLCRSTMPFTDAKLTVTVGTTASSYSLGGATFSSVTAGDVLVFDGINGKITKNGSNYAASVSWTDFPRLTPGKNTLTALDAIRVEYYPVYL